MARNNTDTDPVHIETGIPGDAQEGSFMNATLQDHGELEFSIATHISVPDDVRTEDRLRDYLDWVLREMVAAVPQIPFWPGPSVQFTVELGPAGGGEPDEIVCIERAYVGGKEEQSFSDWAHLTVQDEGLAIHIAELLLEQDHGFIHSWHDGLEEFRIINRPALVEQLKRFPSDD